MPVKWLTLPAQVCLQPKLYFNSVRICITTDFTYTRVHTSVPTGIRMYILNFVVDI